LTDTGGTTAATEQSAAASAKPANPAPSHFPPPSLDHNRPLLIPLIVQTINTGVIDAVSYLGLGHIFTANMTGNVALLGFALARAPGLSAARTLASLSAFLVGGIIGGRIGVAMAEGSRRQM
jgi:hypothetical protein